MNARAKKPKLPKFQGGAAAAGMEIFKNGHRILSFPPKMSPKCESEVSRTTFGNPKKKLRGWVSAPSSLPGLCRENHNYVRGAGLGAELWPRVFGF